MNTLRWPVIAWALWDWGAAAFQTVVTTFIFSVYITDPSFGDPDTLSSTLGFALNIAGFAIALTAPIAGRLTDSRGHRRRFLAATTAGTIGITAALGLITPHPQMFLPGVILLCLGTVFSELANIPYYAQLSQISTPRTVGKISGFGWAMGYFGGILLMGLLLAAFILPSPWIPLDRDNATHIRVSMVATALWFALFALPVFRAIPEIDRPTSTPPIRQALATAYRDIWHSLQHLRRTHPATLRFLIASALFRDGLAGVFTFGGIIAARSFGFTQDTVIIFAILIQLVAGIATIAAGYLETRIGPGPIITSSLAAMIICGLAIFSLYFTADGAAWVFWVFGTILCVFIGPIQSSARSYLSCSAPSEHHGEVFGLYTTTGRAISFLTPGLFGVAVATGGATIYGIVAIVAVLAAGALALMWGWKKTA